MSDVLWVDPDKLEDVERSLSAVLDEPVVVALRRDLVGIGELAAIFGFDRPRFSNWYGRRRTTKFPREIADLNMGPVFRFSEVVEWLLAGGPPHKQLDVEDIKNSLRQYNKSTLAKSA